MRRHRKEVLRRLDNIEANCRAILAAVTVLATKTKPEAEVRGMDADKLMQEGIANIMSFQAGKKSGERE